MSETQFTGLERMTADPKGRVGVPARYLRVLKNICPDRADRVGVRLTPERSIKVMPAPMYEAELETWSGLDDRIDDERMVLNMSTVGADLLELDNQNRIRLNPLLMKLCGIDRQVVFVGSVRFMQIYAEEVYLEMIQANQPAWSRAQTNVARQSAAPAAEAAPVQYVINVPAGGTPILSPPPGEPSR